MFWQALGKFAAAFEELVDLGTGEAGATRVAVEIGPVYGFSVRRCPGTARRRTHFYLVGNSESAEFGRELFVVARESRTFFRIHLRPVQVEGAEVFEDDLGHDEAHVSFVVGGDDVPGAFRG